MTRKITVLKHVPFEGPAAIADWAESHGHLLQTINLFAGDEFPDLRPEDWLVIMGGPMNVDDEDLYPYLAAEKDFVRQAVENGNTVIGICLGAQLIARSLGASVYPNHDREIGWLPIQLQPGAKQSPIFSNWPDTIEVFHWHGDTFDLPPGAELIASSNGCINQAFTIGRTVIGLQFHIETTQASAGLLLENCSADLERTGKYVQTAAEVAGNGKQFEEINCWLFKMLDRLN